MERIFLSHAGADRQEAETLRATLRQLGHDNLFLDVDRNDGIEPGQKWRDRLAAEVARCGSMLLLLSDAWFDSAWCQAEYATASLLRCRVIPVILPQLQPDRWLPLAARIRERFGDVQWVDLQAGRDQAVARLEKLLHGRDPSALAFDLPKAARPYLGLQSYGDAEKALYFGREGEISQLLGLLREIAAPLSPKRMLVIVGPSGTGKSSLMRAGLWPQIELRRTEFIVAPVFVAESDRALVREPVDMLASALAAIGLPMQTAVLSEATGTQAAGDAHARAVDDERDRRASRDAQLVIGIDQAELLLQEDRLRQAAFCSALSACVGSGRGLAVATLRSDSIDAWLALPGMAVLEPVVWRLQPLPLVRLPDIIRLPARRIGVGVEQALIDEVARDATHGDALPLLSLTLERLWQRPHGDTLLLKDYLALGVDAPNGRTNPIAASVQRAAGEALGDLESAERDDLLQAFVPTLVDVNDALELVPRRAVWRDLPRSAWPALERLVTARLLSADGTEEGRTVTVTHAALLRNWPVLSAHLLEQRGDLRLLREVEHAAPEWHRAGRPDSQYAGELRHAGAQLMRALQLASRPAWAARMGPQGRAYLQACAKAEPRQRSFALAALAVVLLATTVAGLWLQRDHSRQLSLQLSEAAERAADQGQFDRSLRLGLLALRDDLLHAPHPRAGVVVARAAGAHRLRLHRVAHSETATAVAISPDGKLIVTAGRDGLARLWELGTGRLMRTWDHHSVHTVRFTPDGSAVVTAGGEQVQWWPLSPVNAEAKSIFFGDDVRVIDFAISGDGRRMALALSYKSVTLLRVVAVASAPREALLSRTVFGAANPLALNHDGTLLAFEGHSDGFQVWTVDDGGNSGPKPPTEAQAQGFTDGWQCMLSRSTAARFPAADKRSRSTTYSPDCSWLASHDGGSPMLANAGDTQLASLEVPGPGSHEYRFSANGGVVAGLNGDGRVWALAMATRTPLGSIHAHESPVKDFQLSPSGRELVTVAQDGILRVWSLDSVDDVSSLLAQARDVRTGDRTIAAFSMDGLKLAVTGKESTRLLAHPGFSLPGAAAGAKLPTYSMAASMPIGARELQFSRDGRVLVESHLHHVLLRWMDGKQPATVRVEHQPPDPPWTDPMERWFVKEYGFRAIVDAAAARLVTLDHDRYVRLWNARTGVLIAELEHAYAPAEVTMSAAGDLALAWGQGIGAVAWDLAKAQALFKYDPESGFVTSADYDASGKTLAVADNKGGITLLDARSGKVLRRLAHGNEAGNLAFSPDGRMLMSDADRRPRLWHLTAGAQVPRDLDDGSVSVTRWSHDGLTLVTGHSEGQVRVWDAATGRPLTEPLVNTSRAEAREVLMPRNDLVLSLYANGDLRSWRLPWMLAWQQGTLHATICAQPADPKLRQLNAGDVRAAPWLEGREGEDVCSGRRRTEATAPAASIPSTPSSRASQTQR